MNDFKTDVEKLINSSIKQRYCFANEMLYKLCESNPDYENNTIIGANEFVAKIWLIGRSYAAAVERRKKVNIKSLGFNDDFMEYAYDFYYDDVYECFKTSNKYFELFDRLKGIDVIDENAIPIILETHNILMKLFESVSGKDNRSLASKYLHFHFPKLFFIFDSRAYTEIKNYVETKNVELKLIKKKIKNDGYDEVYYDLYLRCYLLYKKYWTEYTKENTDGIEKYFTRLLDSVLLVSAGKTAEKERMYLLEKIKNGEFDKNKDDKGKDVDVEKIKTNIAINIYKSCSLRDELILYLEKDHNFNKEVLNSINKRWNNSNENGE